MTKNKTTQTQTNNTRNEHDRNNKLVFFVSKYLVCNFSTLTQHVLIAKKNLETNIHLQTSKSLNRVKQDMLLFPKNVHAQHYYASKGKMKVKKVAYKSMMNNLVWVKRKNFPIAAMSSFCYRNPK
jgi:hypothetical protein